MKTRFFYLILLVFCSSSLFAQKTGSFSLQVSNTIGSFEEDWGCNIHEVRFTYLWCLGKVVHLGAGAGLGVSNPIKYYSGWKIDAEKSQSTFSLPLYTKFKIDFGTKPTHAYFAANIGTRIALVEGYDGEQFNPFIANVTPAIGIDIPVGGENNIFIEAGLDAIFSRYQQIEYAYSDVLNDFIYDRFEKKSDGGWAGLYFSVGFSF